MDENNTSGEMELSEEKCIPEIILSCLKSAFRPADFTKVEQVFISREKKIKEEAQKQVIQVQKELEEKKKELETIKTEDPQVKIAKLEKELSDKKKELESIKMFGTEEDELKERIKYLNKKMARDEADKLNKIEDLEHAKRRAENEVAIWKKRFQELETQLSLRVSQLEEQRLSQRVSQLEEQNSCLVRVESQLSGKLIAKVPNEVEGKKTPQDIGIFERSHPNAEISKMRLPKRNLAAQRERTGRLKLDDMVDYFHLPIEVAAKKLEICPTVLKKICRKNGMQRWPYRKIKSLDRQILNLESSLEEKNGEERALAGVEIERLKQERERICNGSSRNPLLLLGTSCVNLSSKPFIDVKEEKESLSSESECEIGVGTQTTVEPKGRSSQTSASPVTGNTEHASANSRKRASLIFSDCEDYDDDETLIHKFKRKKSQVPDYKEDGIAKLLRVIQRQK